MSASMQHALYFTYYYWFDLNNTVMSKVLVQNYANNSFSYWFSFRKSPVWYDTFRNNYWIWISIVRKSCHFFYSGPLFEQKFSILPQVANSGSSVTFNCSVEGGDARVRWLHDGVPVGGGERILRVHGVVRAHRGMYQCFAERDLDSAQAAAELRLGGKRKMHLI